MTWIVGIVVALVLLVVFPRLMMMVVIGLMMVPLLGWGLKFLFYISSSNAPPRGWKIISFVRELPDSLCARLRDERAGQPVNRRARLTPYQRPNLPPPVCGIEIRA